MQNISHFKPKWNGGMCCKKWCRNYLKNFIDTFIDKFEWKNNFLKIYSQTTSLTHHSILNTIQWYCFIVFEVSYKFIFTASSKVLLILFRFSVLVDNRLTLICLNTLQFAIVRVYTLFLVHKLHVIRMCLIVSCVYSNKKNLLKVLFL